MGYKMIKNNNDTKNHRFNDDNVINLKENGKYKELNLCEANITEMIDIEDLNLELVEYEYNTIVGRIDILCENNNKKLIPIEVKLGTAGDSAIGQILGYMKVMNTNSGVIIARDFSNRVKFLANDYNIKLIYYIVFEEYYKEENKTLIYNGLINEFKNENFLLLESNFIKKRNQEIEEKINTNEKLDIVNTNEIEESNNKNVINTDKKLNDKNTTRIEMAHDNWHEKYNTWKIENQNDWDQQLCCDCKLKEKKQREEEKLEAQKYHDKWLQGRIDKMEEDKNETELIIGSESQNHVEIENKTKIKKEIDSNLSNIEQIRLKSIDPDFINDCTVAVNHNREVRQEKEYAALLKQRAADDVELRNRARVGFEAECVD